MLNKPSGFERIYATNLVYVPDCWKLCGDAHCCSFKRYKSRFKMIARTPSQELLLLPGEYKFLAEKGWLDQFRDHEHKILEFPIDGYTLKVESIVSRRPNCACEHDTRPTICRLYPLLPRFEVDGRLIGSESMSIFEEMERIAGMEAACQLTALPFDQFNKFLAIADELGQNPSHLFYVQAYSITKRHISDRLAERFTMKNGDIFALFEAGYIRQNLIDTVFLRGSLNRLARQFEKHYGDRFRLN